LQFLNVLIFVALCNRTCNRANAQESQLCVNMSVAVVLSVRVETHLDLVSLSTNMLKMRREQFEMFMEGMLNILQLLDIRITKQML